MPLRIQFGRPRNLSRVSAILGALICFGLFGTGLFILISGGELSGGIPLLPDAINRGIGRVLLILGIVITGLLGACALREAWTLQQQRRKR